MAASMLDTEASVHLYDITSGDHLTRLPYTACSWAQSLNKPGSMSVDIMMSRESTVLNLRELVSPWRVIVAYQQGTEVVHAGPLTAYTWQASSRKLSLTVGGGWTLLSKRLAISRRLVHDWRDRSVLVDEQKPAGDLALTCRGDYHDIACQLVTEALQWGALPISVPALHGGTFTRTYCAWDLATVSDRLTDLTNLEDGITIRFAPRIQSDGSLIFDLRAGE